MAAYLIIIKIILSVFAGIALGASSVYAFNRIPAKWLCDYGEEPEKGMWDVRIKAYPWAIFISLFFVSAGLKLTREAILYEIPALIVIWILLQIAISDKKYMIIPDQFIVALAASAIGFVPFHKDFFQPLLGAAIGATAMLLMGMVGALIYKKESMGFGDVKLMATLGLIFGIEGIITIIFITVFSSAIIFSFLIAFKKLKGEDSQPLGPFIAASAALYLLFQAEIGYLSDLIT